MSITKIPIIPLSLCMYRACHFLTQWPQKCTIVPAERVIGIAHIDLLLWAPKRNQFVQKFLVAPELVSVVEKLAVCKKFVRTREHQIRLQTKIKFYNEPNEKAFSKEPFNYIYSTILHS